ncbi:MAG: hypothetical protein HW389_313 [Bacteroidetes bacterium]|nr:hypothetical protein [Bacteroidota bacterium]
MPHQGIPHLQGDNHFLWNSLLVDDISNRLCHVLLRLLQQYSSQSLGFQVTISHAGIGILLGLPGIGESNEFAAIRGLAEPLVVH